MTHSWIPSLPKQDLGAPDPKTIIKEHLLDLIRRDLTEINTDEFSSMLKLLHINVLKQMFNKYRLSEIPLEATEYSRVISALHYINNRLPSHFEELDGDYKVIDRQYSIIQSYLDSIILQIPQP